MPEQSGHGGRGGRSVSYAAAGPSFPSVVPPCHFLPGALCLYKIFLASLAVTQASIRSLCNCFASFPPHAAHTFVRIIRFKAGAQLPQLVVRPCGPWIFCHSRFNHCRVYSFVQAEIRHVNGLNGGRFMRFASEIVAATLVCQMLLLVEPFQLCLLCLDHSFSWRADSSHCPQRTAVPCSPGNFGVGCGLTPLSASISVFPVRSLQVAVHLFFPSSSCARFF